MNRTLLIATLPQIIAKVLVGLRASAIHPVGVMACMAMPAFGQLTVTNPAENDQRPNQLTVGPVADAPVAPRMQGPGMQGVQVRVNTVKLLVDSELRSSIYQQIGTDDFSVQNSVNPPLPSVNLATVVAPMHQRVTVRSPTTSAMSVIERSTADQLIALVNQSKTSSVAHAPAIMLSNGKVAEMNDVAERPFVIGLNSETTDPKVAKFQDGMKIRMLAKPRANATQFIAEIISSRITRVGQAVLPASATQTGDAVTVQVPMQENQSVVVSANLAEGQCLLVDPYVTKSVTATEESSAPMIGNIPFIGKNFSSSVSVQVDRHVLVLMMPSIVK